MGYVDGKWDPVITPRAPTLSAIYPGLHTSIDERGRMHYTYPDGSRAEPSAHAVPASDSRSALVHFIERSFPKFGLLSAWPAADTSREMIAWRYSSTKLSNMSSMRRIESIANTICRSSHACVYIYDTICPPFYDEYGNECAETGASVSIFTIEKQCNAPPALAHALYLRAGQMLVVLDTNRDWRFAAQGKAQFIACVPLVSDGVALGALAVWDDAPRDSFDAGETLQELAHVAVHELQLWLDSEQLKQRDAMKKAIEQFTRHFLFIESDRKTASVGQSERYEHIYEYAAQSICESLDLDGTIMLDLSSFSLFEEARTSPVEGLAHNVQDVILYLPNGDSDEGVTVRSPPEYTCESNVMFPPVTVIGAWEKYDAPPARNEPLTYTEMQKLCDLIGSSQQGGLHDDFTPWALAKLLPPTARDILFVPIFGIRRQPYCLVIGYYCTRKHTPVLDQASEIALLHMRSVGYMMLYVVLKQTVVLADRAKSFFISNMSHELRTPLHGILASTEMLQDTPMNAMQVSFVDTIESCGKGLLELVNHVLDYTKLQGGQSVRSAPATHVDTNLVTLVQEVCDSSWVGFMNYSSTGAIGSTYTPSNTPSSSTPVTPSPANVELIIDIAHDVATRDVRFDSGGIRRVLMNLVGNALKFTSSGYVQVSLEHETCVNSLRVIRLSVRDTGCGISREFLDKKLFQPFSQENPMLTGTGLGLSIVKSIVASMVQGDISVWSEQGKGTHISLTCELEELPESLQGTAYVPSLNAAGRYTVHMLGFDQREAGQRLLAVSLRRYMEHWWKFKVVVHSVDDPLPKWCQSDMLLVNEEADILGRVLHERPEFIPPAVVATYLRADDNLRTKCNSYYEAGGIARILFKPIGPARLEAHLDLVKQYLDSLASGEELPREEFGPLEPLPRHIHPLSGLKSQVSAPENASPNALASVDRVFQKDGAVECSLSFTTSRDETSPTKRHVLPMHNTLHAAPRLENYIVRKPRGPLLTPLSLSNNSVDSPLPSPKTGAVSTVVGEAVNAAVNAAAVNVAGSLVTVHAITAPEDTLYSPLKTATSVSVRTDSDVPSTPQQSDTPSIAGSPASVVSEPQDNAHVLFVDDNAVNRQVLAAYLRKLRVEYEEACDGLQGVTAFKDKPPGYFSLVIMDLSMPNMDGMLLYLTNKVSPLRLRSVESSGNGSVRGPRYNGSRCICYQVYHLPRSRGRHLALGPTDFYKSL